MDLKKLTTTLTTASVYKALEPFLVVTFKILQTFFILKSEYKK